MNQQDPLFTETYARYMHQQQLYGNEFNPEQELQTLSMFVEPLLNYPDQYILACSANRGLFLYSDSMKRILCPKLSSKDDLWMALGTLTPDLDILTAHILQSLVQTQLSASTFAITFLNARYTVESRFVVGMEGSRNLILSLVPQLAPTQINGLGNYQYMQESAANYNMKLNDYVNNCRNDDIYYHDQEPAAVSERKLSWQSGRRGSQMGEFIPSMCQPELLHYVNLVKDEPQDIVSVKVSMDSYYHDPVDPDSIPPSFCVNNTSNTGDTGAQIARRSAHTNNNSGDKRCYACGTEKSPEWRRGPEGPKTLCNACGLRYAKQLRAGNA